MTVLSRVSGGGSDTNYRSYSSKECSREQPARLSGGGKKYVQPSYLAIAKYRTEQPVLKREVPVELCGRPEPRSQQNAASQGNKINIKMAGIYVGFLPCASFFLLLLDELPTRFSAVVTCIFVR